MTPSLPVNSISRGTHLYDSPFRKLHHQPKSFGNLCRIYYYLTATQENISIVQKNIKTRKIICLDFPHRTTAFESVRADQFLYMELLSLKKQFYKEDLRSVVQAVTNEQRREKNLCFQSLNVLHRVYILSPFVVKVPSFDLSYILKCGGTKLSLIILQSQHISQNILVSPIRETDGGR